MANPKKDYDWDKVAGLYLKGMTWQQIADAIGYEFKPRSLQQKFQAEHRVPPQKPPKVINEKWPDFSGENVTPSKSDGRVTRCQPTAEAKTNGSNMGWV